MNDVAKISDLNIIFNRVITYLLGFAGITLFILLIIGGFRLITSGGDPKAVEAAKGTITSALTGLLIVLLAYTILVVITKITGVDITTFSVVL